MTDLVGIAARIGAAWGACAAPPRLVVNRENAVFELRLADGRRGALRLHRAGYQSDDSILSELRWTERLANAGYHCPTPLRTPEGDLIVAQDDLPRASLIRWIDADPIGAMGRDYGLDPSTYRDVGALIGSLHRTTDTLDLTGIKRPDWSASALLGDMPAWGRFWENAALSREEAALLTEVRQAARSRLAALTEPDIGLIHADVLQENILQNDDGLWLIDFDDAGVGYRLYDLGTALIQHIADPRYDDLATALAEGYQDARGGIVSKDDLALFTLLRGLASCGWVMSRAAQNDPRQRIYAERALRLAKGFLA